MNYSDQTSFEETPTTEAIIEDSPVVEEPAETVTQTETIELVDRSAYNCLACKGEGLKDERTLCPNCGGTGKI